MRKPKLIVKQFVKQYAMYGGEGSKLADRINAALAEPDVRLVSVFPVEIPKAGGLHDHNVIALFEVEVKP